MESVETTTKVTDVSVETEQTNFTTTEGPPSNKGKKSMIVSVVAAVGAALVIGVFAYCRDKGVIWSRGREAFRHVRPMLPRPRIPGTRPSRRIDISVVEGQQSAIEGQQSAIEGQLSTIEGQHTIIQEQQSFDDNYEFVDANKNHVLSGIQRPDLHPSIPNHVKHADQSNRTDGSCDSGGYQKPLELSTRGNNALLDIVESSPTTCKNVRSETIEDLIESPHLKIQGLEPETTVKSMEEGMDPNFKRNDVKINQDNLDSILKVRKISASDAISGQPFRIVAVEMNTTLTSDPSDVRKLHEATRVVNPEKPENRPKVEAATKDEEVNSSSSYLEFVADENKGETIMGPEDDYKTRIFYV